VYALYLVGEYRAGTLQHRKVYGLADLLRKFGKQRTRDLIELDMCGGGQPDQGRSESNTAGRRGGDEEMLLAQGVYDSLNGGSRKADSLGDLPETQSVALTFQGAQHIGSAGNDLNAVTSLRTLRGVCSRADFHNQADSC
jgi:hypothetical protein